MADCKVILSDPEIQKKLFGDRKVPKDLIDRLVDDINEIKSGGGNYEQRVGKYIKEKQEYNQLQKLVRANNLMKARALMEFNLNETFYENPEQGVKSILTFSHEYANGGRDSVMASQAALRGQYFSYLTGELVPDGLMDVFVMGRETGLDKEIYKAVDAFSRGKEPTGVSKEALRIGKVVNDMNKMFFADMRNMGVPVRFLEGYIAPQTHSIDKIKSIGFDKWKAVVSPLIDYERTFGVHANNQKKIDAAMLGMYNQIVSGRTGVDAQIGGKEIEDTILNVGYTRNMSDRLSESRFLHFKSSDGAYEYNQAFGKYGLAETLMADISKKASMLGAVRKLGSNPEGMVAAHIERMKARYRSDGRVDLVDKLQREQSSIMNMYKEVMGDTSIPGQNVLAKTGQTIRTLNALSKLGFAGIRSITNFATAAAELRSATGKNLLEAHWDIVNNFLSTIPEADRAYWARQAGLFVDDFSQELLNAGFGRGETIGTKSMRLMFKYNGLNLFTNNMKIANAKGLMRNLGESADLEFGKLRPHLQANLLTQGFEAKDWDIMRRYVETGPDGMKYLTPEAVRSAKADPLVVDRAVDKRMSQSAYLRDLDIKLSGWLATSGDWASTTATARERNIINSGSFTGTWEGEIRRLLFQFKTFPLQAIFFGQRVMNSTPDMDALARGIAKSEKGLNRNIANFAPFLVGATVLGYVGQALIDTANGKGVKDPRRIDTWVDSMTKGGAGGLYTEFLLGEYDRFNFAENILGPTIGQTAPIATLVATGRNALFTGDEKLENKVMKDATRLIRNNIPFQQLPLMRQSLDYLMYDVINESLSPGYRDRRKRYKREEAEKFRLNEGWGE